MASEKKMCDPKKFYIQHNLKRRSMFFFFILKKVLPFLSGDAAMKAKEALDLLKSFSSDFDTKM